MKATVVPLAAVLLLAGSLAAQAQQAGRVYRIGFVSTASPGPPIEAFRQGLREVGYVEGKDVIIEARSAEGRRERLPELVAEAARTMNVNVDLLDAGNATDLDRAFAAIGASRAQGIIVTNDPFFFANRARLIQFAASKRLPAVYFFKLFADAGGLMAYGASLEESYRRAAMYVDKILKGAKPADLPIEQPTKFELAINLRAARALGLTIPQSLLLRADQIIE
ncbi:MAG: ABC transporter substrate-binding protein [Candidatus Rokuibacteriota bacterium]